MIYFILSIIRMISLPYIEYKWNDNDLYLMRNLNLVGSRKTTETSWTPATLRHLQQ
jgi:hypothetical protein